MIAGLDLARGLERFGGDKASYLQILRSFMDGTRHLLESLKTPTKEILPAYAITVHGIKGSAKGICADMVGDKAEALEMAAKAGGI